MSVDSYYDRLRQLTLKITVTDKAGRELSLQSGFEKALNLIRACRSQGRKLMFVGNGASASISSHMAVDFWKNAGIKTLTFNDLAQLTCLSNDLGYAQVFAHPVKMFADRGDILLAISSSGKSVNILNAVKAARAKGIKVITLSGFSGTNPLCKSGEVNFYLPATSYGQVEVMHHSICHCLLDTIVSERKKRAR